MAKTTTKTTAKKTSTKAKSSTAKSKTTKAKPKVTAKAKKTAATKKTPTKSKKKAADTPVEVLNETGNRKTAERRKAAEPVATKRRKTVRRRQIDPTTCERDYTDQEIQFMHAMDEYKQLSGRMFPTCSEILEVLKKIGYRQIADAQVVYDPSADQADAEQDSEDGSEFASESCV
jgi:hypothetical protein